MIVSGFQQQASSNMYRIVQDEIRIVLGGDASVLSVTTHNHQGLYRQKLIISVFESHQGLESISIATCCLKRLQITAAHVVYVHLV